jgi:plasmid stabilization system protein ParE
VRIHPEAILELRGAANWYEDRRAGLGQEFVRAVDAAIEAIVDAPDQWPRFAGASRYVLGRFPYNVIFRSAAAQIDVLAIAHHRRRPGYWQRRR